MIKIEEIECKSVLCPSGIPSVDYALNPYVGCMHGCVYCYATFMKRYTGHGEPWGGFVDVKVNAAAVLRKELPRRKLGQVMLGTVTDVYQPVEKRYGITRACLEELGRSEFPISILTKSDLVLRDVDLLSRCKRCEVGFTITTLDDRIRRQFEPRSSPVNARLDALQRLTDLGIKTWVFFGPVLPYFSDGQREVEAFFQTIAKIKVDRVLVDTMNFRGDIWRRIYEFLKEKFPQALEYYRFVQGDRRGYRASLKDRLSVLAERHALECEFRF